MLLPIAIRSALLFAIFLVNYPVASVQIPQGRPIILPGKYLPQDEGFIGTGADGTVSLVLRSSDNKTFAAKCFSPRRPSYPEAQYNASIHFEHWVGSVLDHPNIVDVFELVDGTQSPCQIMEYYPKNLRQALRSEALSRKQIDCIFLELLSAVAYMHSMGFAHRDLKPGNIMINSSGVAKLIDFGTASLIQHPLSEEVEYIHGVWGSSEYAAPECHEEKTYDGGASDIWSLAMLYIFCTTGAEPWTSATTASRIFLGFMQWRDSFEVSGLSTFSEAFISNPPRNEIGFLNGLPLHSVDLIMRMLEIDSNRRPTWSEVFTDPWIHDLTATCNMYN